MGFRPRSAPQTVTMPEDSEWFVWKSNWCRWTSASAGTDSNGAGGLTMLDVIHSVERMAGA